MSLVEPLPPSLLTLRNLWCRRGSYGRQSRVGSTVILKALPAFLLITNALPLSTPYSLFTIFYSPPLFYFYLVLCPSNRCSLSCSLVFVCSRRHRPSVPMRVRVLTGTPGMGDRLLRRNFMIPMMWWRIMRGISISRI